MSEKTKVIVQIKPDSKLTNFKNAIKSQNFGRKILHNKNKDELIIEGVAVSNLKTVYKLAYQHGLQPT